ncbi:plasma membrane fusion protein PRM1 [Cryptococcus wingfieldii CBS 7118]|uniref:Plasma membrane fusion protein PRM1 n=1 Tax=Cryptococcus wingfieldii CBS 7118 TaxID=1295528 RepID=A0A1E3JBM1_9TREE|nr:plasma membrane fusion protein PRM1 [Cryptococcus wingfieldii CBS 7118]ODN97311.1 plasma membrane fusion protein PRM1 [Cryptococcus wingfieldii CBS 7118]
MAHLQAPTRINPEEVIPLSPPIRPPFVQYSSSPLPPTPHTPYSPAPLQQRPTSMPLRPYLALLPRIILTFCSPCLLPMILTIAHLIQNRSSTASLASSLKSSLLSACSGLAKGAASVQAIPRYLAMQTNQEAVRATQATILAVGTMLMDAIQIIEAVVNFIVDTYRSLLLCTIELAISDSVTSTLNSVRTDIQDDISSANNIIQSAVSGINTVTNLVNVNLTVPSFTIPSLSFLANVTIPTTFEDGLLTLNSSLPTLNDLKEKMNEIIDTPFELLISEINSTRLEMAASFNSSILPVPSLSSLSASSGNDLSNELCSDLDTSLIDDTAKALHKLSSIAIGLMFLLLFLVWAALAIWEWRKWKIMKDTVETIQEEWQHDGRSDAWRMVAIVEHPVLERYSSHVLNRVSKSPRTRTNIRWFMSYLAHPTCLALLFISIIGFLSIQFQLLALNAIKSNADSNANATVTASSNALVAKLNAAALNSSQEYADSYNTAIKEFEDRINNELFGSWVNTTAVTLNTTLVQFYDDVESILNTTFGDTILYNPINTFMYCILGSKITNLEKGLTWISEHAFVDLPTLSSDVLLLSNGSMEEIATPIASAAVGSSDDDDDDGVVGTLITHFESALKVERVFYGIMLAFWLLLFLIGLIIVIWYSGGKDKYMALRGMPPTGPDGFGQSGQDIKQQPKWKGWMTNDHPIYESYAEKQFRGTSPSPGGAPNLVVPSYDLPHSNDEKSFFRHVPDSRHGDPTLGRQSSGVRNTLASLAAPGQSFLKLTGRKLTGTPTPAEDEVPFVAGQSSELYSRDHANSPFPRQNSVSSDRPNSPQPFWVDKFYGAVEGVRAFFPTRGQKHGAALRRSASQRTEKSFGASQVPTARTPRYDWANEAKKKNEPEWTMVDAELYGRDIDGEPGRYPAIHSHEESNASDGAHAVYPRPMSRAPTLGEGMSALLNTPFRDQPPLPAGEQHDSVDYLEEYNSTHSEHEHFRDVASPTSSSMSYFAAEPQLASASKVQVDLGTGSGHATTALAEIMRELQERRDREGPFSDPHGGNT